MYIDISRILVQIKKDKPFILNITNYYTMDFVANGIRCMGAFPIMSNAEKEIEELLALSQSVVINLGKLDDEFVTLCFRICELANKLNKPIILDPIGAGASRYRTDISLKLINDHKISIIRAYENEISAIAKANLPNASDSPLENAKLLSKQYQTAVVMNGKENTIVDGEYIEYIEFHSHFLGKIAGIGGLLTSLLGVFHGIEENRFNAAVAAVTYYGSCVKAATARAEGPASFKVILLDALYQNTSCAYG